MRAGAKSQTEKKQAKRGIFLVAVEDMTSDVKGGGGGGVSVAAVTGEGLPQ